MNSSGLIYETQPNSLLSYNEEHMNAYGLVVILTAVATLKVSKDLAKNNNKYKS